MNRLFLVFVALAVTAECAPVNLGAEDMQALTNDVTQAAADLGKMVGAENEELGEMGRVKSDIEGLKNSDEVKLQNVAGEVDQLEMKAIKNEDTQEIAGLAALKEVSQAEPILNKVQGDKDSKLFQAGQKIQQVAHTLERGTKTSNTQILLKKMEAETQSVEGKTTTKLGESKSHNCPDDQPCANDNSDDQEPQADDQDDEPQADDGNADGDADDSSAASEDGHSTDDLDNVKADEHSTDDLDNIKKSNANCPDDQPCANDNGDDQEPQADNQDDEPQRLGESGVLTQLNSVPTDKAAPNQEAEAEAQAAPQEASPQAASQAAPQAAPQNDGIPGQNDIAKDRAAAKNAEQNLANDERKVLEAELPEEARVESAENAAVSEIKGMISDLK